MRCSSRIYVLADNACSCALRYRAAATNFMARVICCVFFTERMRRLMSSCVGIRVYVYPNRRLARGCRPRREPLLEFREEFLQAFAALVVNRFLCGDLVQQRACVCLGKRQQIALEAFH